MKNLFKCTVSILVICILLFTGCAIPKSSLPGELFGQDYSNLDTLNLLAPSSFISQNENAGEIKQQWIDAMSERYGVKLNIISDSYQDGKRTNDAMNQLYNTLYGKATFGGMAYVYNYDLLAKAIQNGVAVPLEDYLADNAAWNALPEELKSAFMVDGHLYAIPAMLDWNMNARSVCTETLEQTGIDITDLNSFKEYAIAVKKTGKYESVLGSTGADCMGDILNAYGLYTTKYSGHPFSYDPTEDCVVDFLTKDTAITALEYLRGLYADGVLKLFTNNSSSPYKDFTAGTCATYYDEFMLDDKYTEVFTLNPAYPQLLDCSVTGYIMTKDTPQPKETVNFFVNMLFGSEQNYFDCYMGLSENYVLNSDGSTTIRLDVTEDGKPKDFPSPGLVGALPGAFPHSAQNFKLEVNGTLSPEMADSVERSNQYFAAIDNAVKQGRAVKVPVSYRQIHSLKFYEDKSDINYMFTNCIRDAITDTDYTVQEIVAQYRLDMLNIGGNTLLDEMNAAIGKKTAYYYD